MAELELQSTLTCPQCGHCASETMPTTACQYFYECLACGASPLEKEYHFCMTRRARHRLRIALLALLCMLFQQAALAAYLCPVEQVPAPRSALAGPCAQMDMAQTPTNPALCDKHCNPDHQLITDAASLSVPALALPPPVFVLAQAEPRIVLRDEVPITRSDPPPRLRYCSLLI